MGAFNRFIKECAENDDFRAVVKTTDNAELTGSFEELVLKFFAYFETRNEFVHSVKGFLNDYMASKTAKFKNEADLRSLFEKTFHFLNKHLPSGIVRGSRKNITPLVLYEAIAVGTADALKSGLKLNSSKLQPLLDDEKLKSLTTGATNSRNKLIHRISYVSDMLKQ